MRRTQDSIFGSLPCRSTRNELQGLGILTSPSSSRLDSLQMNMPSFPTIKESKLQYLSTSKIPAFASRSERNFYTRIGGDLISGVDKLRNLVQRRDKHISSSDNSDATKFVGYRFIGNQIDYGPIKKINTDAGMSTSKRSEDQPTSYVQNHPISDQKIGVGSGSCILRQSSQLGSSASSIHGAETAGITISTSQEPDLLSSYASKIENLVQPQQSGDCNDSLLDQNALLQSWDASTVATPFGDPSENASTRLSTLPPPHQDFPLPPLEAFSEQTTAAFVDDILQQHCSPPPPLPLMFQTLDEIFEQAGNDDSLMNGLRNTYDPFDIQDFDESLFSQDD